MHLGPGRFTWGNTASSVLAVSDPRRPTGDELGTMYAERQPVVREALDSLQAGWLEEVDILLADGAGASAWDDLTGLDPGLWTRGIQHGLEEAR